MASRSKTSANTLFRQWGVGKKGKDEGIMLLLAIKDHRDRIEVGYGLEPILPDGFAGSVLRGMRPLLRQGAYGQAMISRPQRRWARDRPRQRRCARMLSDAAAQSARARPRRSSRGR